MCVFPGWSRLLTTWSASSLPVALAVIPSRLLPVVIPRGVVGSSLALQAKLQPIFKKAVLILRRRCKISSQTAPLCNIVIGSGVSVVGSRRAIDGTFATLARSRESDAGGEAFCRKEGERDFLRLRLQEI